MTIYEKYCHLDIDGRWIGLEKSDMNIEYFCTPVDARIIGWENSIHYCFIRGYRDMVFAVNPEPCVIPMKKCVYCLSNLPLQKECFGEKQTELEKLEFDKFDKGV